MAIAIKDFKMAIRVESTDAMDKFQKLGKEISQVKAEMELLEKAGKKDSEEYKTLKSRMDELNRAFYEQRKAVGINGLTMNELRNGAKKLRRELNKVVPGTAEWHRLNADIKRVNARMQELRTTSKATKLSLSAIADGFNKYAGVVAGAIASLTGITLTARKCVDEFAQMEDAEAQVIKYTGMTKEQVIDLNEEFKRMDTRTPRDRLNALAGDAGRLGLSSKQAILEFVDAADKINVSLGEDLGENAVANIGKLAMMFGEADTKGLRGAMLATGSAVNELAQASSACEPYIVDFTARVAGAGKTAGLSQTQIMGYASVLDQNMQKQEMAATAFQTLVMKMFQAPEKFAAFANKSIAEFTKMVKEDANGAVLDLLENLSKKGGLDQLAPMFQEMGLDGVRASGVLATLADNVENIRKQQELANEAYEEGTSVIEEFNVQNNTAQGELEKARDKFRDVRIELGEKLKPLMRYMFSSGRVMIKGLKAVIDFTTKYSTTIITLISSIAAYTAITKASIIVDKLKVFWTNKIVVSLKALKTALLSNPWGIAMVAIATVTAYLIDMRKSVDKLTASQRVLKDLNDEVAASVNSERDNMASYLRIAKDETKSKEERLAAIRKLNNISPQYLGNLTLETINTEKATKAVKKYVDSLVLLETIKKGVAKIDELNEQRENLLKNGSKHSWTEELKAGFANLIKGGQESIGLKASKWEEDIISEYANKGVQEMMAIDEQINAVKEKIDKAKEDLIALEVEAAKDKPTGGELGGKNKTTELDKEYQAKQAAQKAAYNQELNELKKLLLDKSITQEEYDDKAYSAEIKHLSAMEALAIKYGKDSSAIRGQIYDKMIAQANALHKRKEQLEKLAAQKSLDELDKVYKQSRTAIKQQYLNGEIKTAELYQQKLKELEENFLNDKKNILLKYSQDIDDINEKIADKQIQNKDDRTKEQRDKMQSAYDKTDKPKDKAAINQAMYEADLITAEQYEERKTEIARKAAEQRMAIAQASADTIAQVASAMTNAIGALQDIEVRKASSAWDKKIAKARKAGKDTTKLEQKKEKELNAIRKKYADKMFASQVMQVTASTAVAAMEAYKAMAGIPVIGPALGAIASAAAVAAGATQIAVAKQQRDEAKGLITGGYSDDYVEGFTRKGNPNETAGAIPVHKNEFVANHKAVGNPHVKQFLDVFDIAQRNGTISMLNTSQILSRVNTNSGLITGGYSSGETAKPETKQPSDEKRTQLVELVYQCVVLLKELNDKPWGTDPRAMRDAINRINSLERNASR